jgi:hypothetical protein
MEKKELKIIDKLQKKNGHSVETDWPLTIACHMKKGTSLFLLISSFFE